jgi:dipeptidyl aminopeptidase/acylaminoacyl peptidase
MKGKSRVLSVGAAGAAGVVLAAVVAGCASGGSTGLAVRQGSPACSSTNLPAWSPDGKQIAFVGRRLGHGPLPQRAICIANADGKNAAPLSQTVCTRRCRLDLIDSPSQLFWVRPSLLLYGDDFRIFTIPVAGTPQPLGSQPGSFEQFAVDSAGDRVAAGYSNCPQCAGPVTVLSVPSGRLVGRIGGTTLDNITPSISPDGTQIVFVRSSADGSGQTGIWTASAAGSNLRRLVPNGFTPLWSPAGNRIAYLTPSEALELVAPQGGASRTLVARSVGWLFGWSPDGKQIAFQGPGGWLEVVGVATGNVRKLLRLRFAPNVVWSPSSQELLVKTQPLRQNRCASLWRVPAGGGKPQLLRNC